MSPTDVQGTYAQFVAINEHYVSKKPESLDHRDAASLPFAALTAWEAIVNVANVKRGQDVLVMGASGGVGNQRLFILFDFLGTFAIQLLKHKGCNIFATSNPKRII
jgi:NADPH:quinone reductase-like Zn-dependent oxidoreductase